MNYKLARNDLVKCLNRLKDSDNEDVVKDDEFIFYHLNRNFFNTLYLADESERPLVNQLKQVGSSDFKDNLGRIWTELTVGIVYHRPFSTFADKFEYGKDFLKPRKERFSRKFISLDNHIVDVGYAGCEYELIVRHDHRLISGEFMETYNFGVSGIISTAIGLHKKFDVYPHVRIKGNYEIKYYQSNKIEITDA